MGTLNTSSIGSIVDQSNNEVQFYAVLNIEGLEATTAGVLYNVTQNRFQFRKSATEKAEVGTYGVVFYATTAGSTDTITINAPASVTSYTVTLPATAPLVGQSLVQGADGFTWSYSATNETALTGNKMLASNTSGNIIELAALPTNYVFVGVSGSVPTGRSLSSDVTGTEFTVDANSIKVTLAQSIATSASPTFAGMTLTGFSGVVKSVAGVLSASSLVNADINAAAAIDHSKLANMTAGSVLLGNASSVPTATAISGDVTIDASGVATVADTATTGKLLTGLTPTAGAIEATDTILEAFNKLEPLTSLVEGNLLIGDSSGVSQSIAMSGEATITALGAVTLDNDSVTGKVLTGFVASAGEVSSGDSILEAFEKLAPSAGHVAVTIGSPANGLSISTGQELTIDLATSTGAGVVSTGDQTWAGNKTISGNVTVDSLITTGYVDGVDVSVHNHNNTSSGGAQISHLDLSNIGTATHVDIDTHISTSSGHGTASAIVGINDSQTLTNKIYDGGTASSGNAIVVPQDTFTNISALSRDEGRLLYANDIDTLYIDDGTNLKAVGAGSGVKNYVKNTTGDSLSNITSTGIGCEVTSSSGEVLIGNSSIKLTSDGGGAGYTAWELDTIDPFYIGKPFYFGAKTRALTGYTASDMYAVIYCNTDAAEVEGTKVDIPLGDYEVKGFFLVGEASSYVAKTYTLRVYEKSSPASSGSISVDAPYIGEQKSIYANAVTDWASLTTFTISAGTGTATIGTSKARRVGDSLEGIVEFSMTADASTSLTLLLPSGYVIDATKASANQACGEWYGYIGATFYSGTLAVNSTTGVYFITDNGAANQLDQNIPTAAGGIDNGDTIRCHFTVPIVGWSSNIQVADRALEEFVSHDGSNIVYGIAGAVTPRTTPAGVIERLNITSGFTNVQSTDVFILEFNIANTSKWISFNGCTYVDSLRYDETNFIGATIESLADGSINLVRGKYARAVTDAWTTLPEFSRWRVRKTSGGVQVGSTAINARNIIGDTSGTAVPAGCIGEKITGTSTAFTAQADGTPKSAYTLPLNKGVYDIYAVGVFSRTAGAASTNEIGLAISTTNNENALTIANAKAGRAVSIQVSGTAILALSATKNQSLSHCLAGVAVAADATNYYTVLVSNGSTFDGDATMYAIRRA